MADALDQIPPRVKYYLLEYKDRNMEDFISQYGKNTRLRDLSFEQLFEAFKLATTKDLDKLKILCKKP